MYRPGFAVYIALGVTRLSRGVPSSRIAPRTTTRKKPVAYRNKTYVCFDGDNDIHYEVDPIIETELTVV